MAEPSQMGPWLMEQRSQGVASILYRVPGQWALSRHPVSLLNREKPASVIYAPSSGLEHIVTVVQGG